MPYKSLWGFIFFAKPPKKYYCLKDLIFDPTSTNN